MKKIGWVIMAVLAVGVAGYAISLTLVPTLGPGLVQELFERTPLAAFAHFIGGGLVLLAGAFQVNSRLRERYTRAHRWTGRLYVAGVLAGYQGGGQAGLNLPAGEQQNEDDNASADACGLDWIVGYRCAWLAATVEHASDRQSVASQEQQNDHDEQRYHLTHASHWCPVGPCVAACQPHTARLHHANDDSAGGGYGNRGQIAEERSAKGRHDEQRHIAGLGEADKHVKGVQIALKSISEKQKQFFRWKC